MANKLLEGTFAALLTPRTDSGELDPQAMGSLVRFLGKQGLQGFALNGATGEFCLTRPPELARMLQVVDDSVEAGLIRICGIGSNSLRGCMDLAEVAAAGGARAVLLPTPYFFRYEQEDIFAFATAVADRCPLPVLLYNLPQFSSPYEVPTVLQLIGGHPNIIGIKDSSGSLEILKALTQSSHDCCRIIGNDSALGQARRNGLCDAVISGVACALPELIAAIFDGDDHFDAHCERLKELLEQIAPFPTPWAIKWLVEARGLGPAHFSQVVSPSRQKRAEQLQQWFRAWLPVS